MLFEICRKDGGKFLEFQCFSPTMEKLRRSVIKIALTPPSERLTNLSPLEFSLIPLLSFASSVYRLGVSFRHGLYRLGVFRKHRLPVPVISVGNLTWGGNGKTPMVEFIARWLLDSGISPLILTRGYGSGDEAKMLQRHFHGTSAKVGVGAKRAATAAHYNFVNYKGAFVSNTRGADSISDRIGLAILDDGMQHVSLCRDLEIVMVNAMMPWGNHRLLPLGPLREPLTALERADIVIIHHADLVVGQDLEAIASTVRRVSPSLPIFLTKMAPSYFFKAANSSCKLPLSVAKDSTFLCVSAIGFAESFVTTVLQLGPKHVDQLDFSDHYLFQTKDIGMLWKRLKKLELQFAVKPVVVVTEKDYDRSPEVLQHLDPYEVLVLCSQLQILPREERTEDDFKKYLRKRLKKSYV